MAVADGHTRSLLDGSGAISKTAALTGGYTWALWSAVGIAAAGALLTRATTTGTSRGSGVKQDVS